MIRYLRTSSDFMLLPCQTKFSIKVWQTEKHDRRKVSESQFELSTASSAMLHDSG